MNGVFTDWLSISDLDSTAPSGVAVSETVRLSSPDSRVIRWRSVQAGGGTPWDLTFRVDVPTSASEETSRESVAKLSQRAE